MSSKKGYCKQYPFWKYNIPGMSSFLNTVFPNCAGVCPQTCMCFRGCLHFTLLPQHGCGMLQHAPYKQIHKTQLVATQWSKGLLKLYTLYTGTLVSKLNKIEGCSHSSKLQLSYNQGECRNSNKYSDLSLYVTNFRQAPVVGPGICQSLQKLHIRTYLRG